MKRIKKMLEHKNYSVLVIPALFSLMISLPVIIPYFHSGFFPTHDGEWAVVRLTDMYRELKDFQIPPRYSGNLNFGYGYPLFNFAYPFPYYLGFLLRFFGLGFVDSVKIIFAASVPLSAFIIYILSRDIWKNALAGAVSALLYVYLPYRLVDLYVRGSIGESVAFVFFPLLFYALLGIKNKSDPGLYIIISACAVAALILTHNIMAVFFIPLIPVFILILSQDRRTLLFTFSALILGLGLSAYFWLPALTEKSNILLSIIPIADRNLYFVSPAQLYIPVWGYGVPTANDAFSYQIGWPHLLAFILAGIVLFSRSLKAGFNMTVLQYRIALVFVFVTMLYIFLMFPPAKVIWESLPLMKEINYPWTLLAPIGFLICLIAGYVTTVKVLRTVGLFLAIIAVVSFIPYAKPQYYVDRGDQFYLTNDATTTSSKEYTPLWVKEIPGRRAEKKVELIRGDGAITDVFFNSKNVKFDISMNGEGIARVNTIYYPGWRAYVNGKAASISYNNDQGVMEVAVPDKKSGVELQFTETPLRLIADSVSLLSFILMLTVSAPIIAKLFRRFSRIGK